MHLNLLSLFLRVSFGATMLLAHGLPKLKSFNTLSTKFPDPLSIGSYWSLIFVIMAEFFCQLLIIVGLKTRIMAIPPIITMIVAAFIFHANDPWQKKEFPLLYTFGFIAISIIGSQQFSLDHKLKQYFQKNTSD